MRKKTFLWVVLVVLVLAGSGGYVAYAKGYIPWFKPQETTEAETTLQTTAVTVGNLAITADGSGTLVASSEANLAFSSNGTLAGLLVQVGDQVQAGDVLAWIDDAEARKAVADAELAVIQAEQDLEDARDTAAFQQAVAQTELAVAQAEANLSTAQSALDDLLNWAPDEIEVKVAQANLSTAQVSYKNTVTQANMWDAQLASTRIKLEDATRSLEEAQANYVNAMDAARDWEKNIESTRENAARALRTAQNNLELAQGNYDLATIDTRQIDIQNAQIKVLNAEQALEELQAPPDETEIAAARLKVQEQQVALQQARLNLAEAQEKLDEADTRQAELALEQAKLKLTSAQKALEGTTLVAPFAGTVTAVNGQVGDNVSGTVVVLVNLGTPVVQFWVEESDLNNVAVGNRINVTFEALPDLTYEGQITRVDPVLVSVGNTPAVQAWASIDVSAHPAKLLGDMNAEVEVVAGEARNALLVPVQALRKLGEDQYAVFVVGANNTLEMRLVEVGLQDYVNAEIRSGLQRGETVSLGEKANSSTSTTTLTTSGRSSSDEPFAFPGGGGFPGGGFPGGR